MQMGIDTKNGCVCVLRVNTARASISRSLAHTHTACIQIIPLRYDGDIGDGKKENLLNETSSRAHETCINTRNSKRQTIYKTIEHYSTGVCAHIAPHRSGPLSAEHIWIEFIAITKVQLSCFVCIDYSYVCSELFVWLSLSPVYIHFTRAISRFFAAGIFDMYSQQ